MFRCCKVCAKIEGENCGGPGNFSGICEPGLSCISKPPLIGAVGICLGKMKMHKKNPRMLKFPSDEKLFVG